MQLLLFEFDDMIVVDQNVIVMYAKALKRATGQLSLGERQL